MSFDRKLIYRTILSVMHYSGIAFPYSRVSPHMGLILTLHHVREGSPRKFQPNGHLSISPPFLEEVITFLKRNDFEFLTLQQVHDRLVEGGNCGRFVAFTFDDGYRNNLKVAAPILQRHGVPYTVFVSPGLVDGTAGLWWEGLEALVRANKQIDVELASGTVHLECATSQSKEQAFIKLLRHVSRKLPERQTQQFVGDLCADYGIDLAAITSDLMMNWEEVAELAADPFCSIGAHTVSHPILSRLDKEDAREEIGRSVEILEQKTGSRPKFFAYPYGSLYAAGPREYEIVKSLGLAGAVTTRPGMIFREHVETLWSLPRISLNGHYQHMQYFAPLTTGLPTRVFQAGQSAFAK